MTDTPSPTASFTLARHRWLPLTWQVGGTVATVAGYAAGTIDIVDVAAHVAILSFVTGLYLAYLVPEHGTRRDKVTIFVYFLYAVGLALVSAPSIFDLDAITPELRVVGGLCLGLVLATWWFLYIEYIADG